MVALIQPGYPGDTGDLIITVAELTEEAEGNVMRFFAHVAGSDLDQADWANRRTPDLAKIRRDLDATIRRLERTAGPQIHDLIGEAYRRGHGNAPLPATIVRREQGLMAELRAAWQGMRRSALRFWNRLMGVGRAQRDEDARRMAIQREFDRLARRGIIGHWDSHGRPYAVVPHVSQILRDQARDAYLDGYFDKVLGHGGDLVVVPVNATACPLCEPWQGRVLSISGLDPDRPSVAEARLAGLWHPNCFPGEVLVSAPSGVRAGDARWYEGDLVVIHTASGKEMPVTPNHPVLTAKGWVAAGALKIGDRVLRYRPDIERVNGVSPGDEQIPARIGDVFDAMRESLGVAPASVPGSAEQFHGDGGNSDVEVVFADSLLRDGREPGSGQAIRDGQLLVGGARLPLLAGKSPAGEVGIGADHPAHGLMSGSGLGGSLCRRHSRVAAAVGLAAGDLDASLVDPSADGGLADIESGRELALRLSGLVSADEVVNIGSRQFAGHVYNLQTGDGWYVANGIVVHNCRHPVSEWRPGQTIHFRVPARTTKRYQAEQRQRAIETHIRHWTLREAVALDPITKAAAARKVRYWTRALGAHIAAHGHTPRRPRRVGR